MEQRTDDRDEADFASVHDLRIPTELNDARSLEARQMATMNAELARLRSSLATARAAEAAAVNEASALAEFEEMQRQEMEERAALADDRASLRQSTEPQPEGTVAAGEGEEAELPVEMPVGASSVNEMDAATAVELTRLKRAYKDAKKRAVADQSNDKLASAYRETKRKYRAASLRQSTEPQPEGTVAAGEGEEAGKGVPEAVQRSRNALAFVKQYSLTHPDVEEGNLAKRRWGGGRRSKRRRSNKKTRKSKRRRSKRLRSKRRKSKKKTRRS